MSRDIQKVESKEVTKNNDDNNDDNDNTTEMKEQESTVNKQQYINNEIEWVNGMLYEAAHRPLMTATLAVVIVMFGALAPSSIVQGVELLIIIATVVFTVATIGTINTDNTEN